MKMPYRYSSQMIDNNVQGITDHLHLHYISPTLTSAPTIHLFPYTTLFRSGNSAGASSSDCAPKTNLPVRREFGLDRKSTRLNSSHRTIAYAVFCLKKK